MCVCMCVCVCAHVCVCVSVCVCVCMCTNQYIHQSQKEPPLTALSAACVMNSDMESRGGPELSTCLLATISL